MNALNNFNKLKNKMTGNKFYQHCKQMLLEKENYSKIVIQKAQQFIDNYSRPNNFFIN